MPQIPSGAVTFLFTDIEGSTRLLKELRDEYSEALEEHQRLLRSAFDEAGGREIDTQGDAFFVVFHRARDAVVAALVGQRSLAEREWPQGSQLRVRMGIHTGEASVSGERYLGVAVHRAARICAAGHGGQVLVSQTAKSVLEDEEVELPDVDFRDLGEQRLKDLDRPVRLYQLIAPGLAEEFPRLRTADTPFAGREGELAKAAEGVPKSRLRKRWVFAAAAVGAIAIVGVAVGVLTASGSEAFARTPKLASGDRSSERQGREPRRSWQSTSNRRRDSACRTVDRRRIGRGMGREFE
jgi:class 3 adenylate cyclase